MIEDLTLLEIAQTRGAIDPYITTTPVHHWRSQELARRIGATDVHVKLEMLQRTGTFKARGAINVMLNMTEAERARGVTAVSAGNHAIAVAYAANVLGVSAKVVMLKTANPVRVAAAQSYGAQVEFAENGAAGFARAAELQQREGRYFVHPFEGRNTSLGTATIGWEWVQQVDGLDAVIVPIGGGGLMSGIASAVKAMQPGTKVYGVEPTGAAVMQRSFEAGMPVRMDTINTIADSLAPPFTTPMTYELCRRHVDALVQVEDADLCDAMRLLYSELKIAAEPAGAAATAALCGPLRDVVQGKRVGVIVCGSNIDVTTFHSLLDRVG
jgi:threonine dehydratase